MTFEHRITARCLLQGLLLVALSGAAACAPTDVEPVGEITQAVAGQRVTVLTYNIKLGGCPGMDSDCERERELVTWRAEIRKLEGTIRSSSADLVLLQEVNDVPIEVKSSGVGVALKNLIVRRGAFDSLAQSLRDRFPYFAFAVEAVNSEPFGNAILSRYPLSNIQSLCLFRGDKGKPGYGAEHLDLPGCQRQSADGSWNGAGNRNALAVEADINGQRVDVITTHFGIYHRVCTGAKDHVNSGCSALVLNRYLASSNKPAILGGDINVLCNTGDVNAGRMAGEQRALGVNSTMNLAVRWDYFDVSRYSGLPATCALELSTATAPRVCDPPPAPAVPETQIDYILGSKSGGNSNLVSDWKLVATSVLAEPNGPASDHKALQATLELLKPAPVRSTWTVSNALIDACSEAEESELGLACSEFASQYGYTGQLVPSRNACQAQ